MPKFEKLTLPSEGEIITFNEGKPNVPNNPIVPFLNCPARATAIYFELFL